MGASIATLDIKRLWGRAGGRCAAPGCGIDLTALIASGNYVVGEMAHVIGRKPSAPRGKPSGGANTYDNLILLCPTHHTHVDKAPEGTYPETLLHEWKSTHEAKIGRSDQTPVFDSFEALKSEVSKLLAANRGLFDAFGPRSSTAQNDPNSNLISVWDMRRVDRIVPNNQRILNLLEANSGLIPKEAMTTVEAFRVHATAYEHHCYHRLDNYPLFPADFHALFS